MTPEEKAKELINKFSNISNWVRGEGFISLGESVGRKVAIVSAEQILNEWTYLNGDPETECVWSDEKEKYWQEVLNQLINNQ